MSEKKPTKKRTTKKKCTTCKKQPKPVVSLTTVEPERLKQAYDYISIASQMNNEKWDYVEEVYQELYPAKQKINRQCRQCLSAVAKAIEYEYKRLNKI